MKSARTPFIILFILLVGFIATVYFTGKQLPNAVASHFGYNGAANDWMERQAYLGFIGGIGVGLPLFMVGIFYLIRFLPSSLINIPHREYWLAPERRDETHNDLLRYSLWYACLCSLFMTGLHGAVMYANHLNPARMPNQLIYGLPFLFLFGTVLWIVVLVSHFRKNKK